MSFGQKLIDKGFFKQEDINKKYNADDLIDIHHILMTHYRCWIPIEEFKKIPIPTLFALMDRINEERKNPIPQRVVIVGILKKGAK